MDDAIFGYANYLEASRELPLNPWSKCPASPKKSHRTCSFLTVCYR